MADYATKDEARAYGFQSLPSDDDLFSSLVTRASRLFDTACGLPTNYFAKGDTAQVASARKFWGRGTDWLKVDPYLSSPAISLAMPNGYTVPSYLEVNHNARPELNIPGEFFLLRTYGDNEERSFAPMSYRTGGWPEGVRVTVTAKWGWDAVPEDVKEAVIETVINTWRTKDQAFARAVGLDTGAVVTNDALPPRAQLIADRYKLAKPAFA